MNKRIGYISGSVIANTGSDTIFIEDIKIPDMQMSLATEANLGVFEDS